MRATLFYWKQIEQEYPTKLGLFQFITHLRVLVNKYNNFANIGLKLKHEQHCVIKKSQIYSKV